MNRTQIIEQIKEKGTFLCVGLDSDWMKLPKHLLKEEHPVLAFNKAIIDATAPYCMAFKPNIAFYETRGWEGVKDFEDTIAYIKTEYPNHLVIADAKRGDIGNTSKAYAEAFFTKMRADALTVAPYMGEDSVMPFLEYKDKWTILLALTSNKGADNFQHLIWDEDADRPLFEEVIITAQKWGTVDNLMFVVGATRAGQLRDIRKIAPNHFLLIPGVGAQGGSLEDVVEYGITKDCGLIVNSSREIIFASSGEDFAEAAAKKAEDLRNYMHYLLKAHGII